MKGFTIFKRLSLSYLALSLIVVFMGVYTTLRFEQLNRITSSISAADSEVIRIVNKTKDNFLSQVGFERKYIVSKDKDFYQQFMESQQIINRQLDEMASLLDDKKKETLFTSLQGSYQKYISRCRNDFNSTGKGSDSVDKEQLFTQFIDKLDQMKEMTKADIKTKIETSNEIGAQALRLNILATLAIIVMTVIIAFFNARTINRPILSLMQGTRKIAKKEFDTPLTISSPPEIKELADSLNFMCSRLRELDQMKEDFISHVSHELRTPLTSIKEATSLLVGENLKEKPSKEQDNLMLIIQEECERLIQAVNSMLDLSRMEAGMMEFQMYRYSLYPLVEKSVAKIKPIADKKEIMLDWHLEQGLPEVFIDWGKIDQVIVNLLGNALKFTASKGKVILSVYRKESTEKRRPSQEMVEICVSDNGCGISQKDLTEIFDKFKKVHGKGTGLGLSIAKNIVTAHGGQIWVRSEPGQGSSFFFTLPACS